MWKDYIKNYLANSMSVSIEQFDSILQEAQKRTFIFLTCIVLPNIAINELLVVLSTPVTWSEERLLNFSLPQRVQLPNLVFKNKAVFYHHLDSVNYRCVPHSYAST
jgi:hypothetical protein